MDHPTEGQSFHRPIVPRYYIEDCLTFRVYTQRSLEQPCPKAFTFMGGSTCLWAETDNVMLQLQGRTSWRLRSNKGVIKRKIAELRMPSFAWDPFCSFWDSPIIALSLNGVPWVTLILFLKYVDFFKSNVPKDLGTCTVLHMFTQVLFWAKFLPMLFIKLKHFFSKWPFQNGRLKNTEIFKTTNSQSWP